MVMPDTQRAIAEAIRVRMDARHVTKQAGADFAGMAYSTFLRSIDGHRPFTLPEFFGICAALNCAPEELIADVAGAA